MQDECKMTKFIEDERGSASVWMVIILVVGLFGFIYAMIDPFVEAMLQEGVNSGIPTEQQNVESSVWDFLPVIVLGALGLWGFRTTQQRRQEF